MRSPRKEHTNYIPHVLQWTTYFSEQLEKNTACIRGPFQWEIMRPGKGTLLAVLWLQLAAAQATQKVLNIAYVYSSGGEYVSNGTIPAVQLAAELISNSSDVLPGYEIVLHEGNSEVSNR